MNQKEALIQSLKQVLLERNEVLAAWEGGSRATKRMDQYSDLDLLMIVQPSKIDEMFSVLDHFFDQAYGIKESYRVPEPSWHGMSQKFYELNDFSPYFYIDIAIMTPDKEDKFTAVDRHGEPYIWFDKEGLIIPEKTLKNAVDEKGKKYYNLAVSGEFLLRLEVLKALARKHYLDANMFGYGYLNKHFIPLLNLYYRKAQVDFGLRYISHYYSKEDIAIVEAFFKATNIDTIKQSFEGIFKRYNELKELLKE